MKISATERTSAGPSGSPLQHRVKATRSYVGAVGLLQNPSAADAALRQSHADETS